MKRISFFILILLYAILLPFIAYCQKQKSTFVTFNVKAIKNGTTLNSAKANYFIGDIDAAFYTVNNGIVPSIKFDTLYPLTIDKSIYSYLIFKEFKNAYVTFTDLSKTLTLNFFSLSNNEVGVYGRFNTIAIVNRSNQLAKDFYLKSSNSGKADLAILAKNSLISKSEIDTLNFFPYRFTKKAYSYNIEIRETKISVINFYPLSLPDTLSLNKIALSKTLDLTGYVFSRLRCTGLAGQ